MSESFYGSTYHYIKCFLIWALVVGLDYLVDFRFEYLWPCWLLVRSVCDSYKYQGALFSAFFTCIAVASDVICYLFVPPMWIFFLGSTYVWVQFLWQTERGLCFPTVFMWIIFIYVEFAFRLRDAKSIPFSIDLCRPFAAHCIGYPVVSLGFGVKSYISYKFRLRRQKEVQAENQFYVQLLEQALPEDCRASKNEKESDSYSKAVPDESGEVSTGKKRHAASNGKLPVSTPGEDAQFCETRQLASHNGAAGASRRDSTPSSPSSSSPFTAQKSSVTCSDHVTSGSISDDVIAAGEAGPHSNNGAVPSGSGKGAAATAVAAAAAAAVAAKNGLAGGGGGGKRVHNNTGGVPGKENNLHSGSGGKGSGVSKGKATSQNAPLNNCVVLKKDDQNSRIIRLESEIKRMRADLQSSRTIEQELRSQLGNVVASERAMKLDLNQTKQDNESLQNRLHNLVQRNQQDKCSLLQLEKRLNDEKRQRQSTEGALASEKKGRREDQEAAAARNTALAAAAALRSGQSNNNGAGSPDGFCSGEACRAKRHELEGAIKGLRRDVAKREEQLRSQERALEQMRAYREAAESQETLMTALNAMKEKNAHLDRALKDENRLKQELLSALHNGKRDMDVLQVIIADKDRQITELRMKMAEFAAVALSPSGYDASGAAGVFGPPPPPPPPPPPQALSSCRPPVSSPGPASQQQAPGSPPVVSCAASMPNGEH